MDHTNLSPTDVFSGHHDYELFLVQKEIESPNGNLNHQDTHNCENQDDILIHATILSHTFALPQFMAQHNYEDLKSTNNSSKVPTTIQATSDQTFNPRCAHNPMVTQWNQSQYPNPNDNFTLPQFMAQPNFEDLDPTDTQSAVPTTLQASCDHMFNPKCAHCLMETQCNYPQDLVLLNKICAHIPSASQNNQVSLSNSFASPYPPDPGEHVLKRSAIATGEQDFPVKWFKFIHPSPKPRMTETPVQKPVHMAYSLIAFMNHKWTINLHDGYPPLNVLLLVEYIPPSIPTICTPKYTMFHFGVDSHPFTKEPQHDFTCLASLKGEMESPFSWNSFLKSPRSSTLCFGEPTLAKLNQEPTLAKINQVKLLCETESYITKSSSIWYNQQHIGAAHSFDLLLELSDHSIFKY